MRYQIRRILFHGVQIPIVLQNQNGPCPLIAIMNVLLLRREAFLNQDRDSIETETLLSMLRTYLTTKLERLSARPNANENMLANAFANFEAAIAMLKDPKLEVGLDVNVHFRGCLQFEFTSELSMFDVYNIRIMHAWVVDPQDDALAKALGNMSYNAATNFAVSGQDSDDEDMKLGKEHEPGLTPLEAKQIERAVAESNNEQQQQQEDKDKLKLTREVSYMEVKGEKAASKEKMNRMLIRDFLNASQKQITVVGLMELHQIVENEELCIFFRNNHFNVLYKLNGNLYTLVTDTGLVSSAPHIVWNRLISIEGDDEYVNQNFGMPTQPRPYVQQPRQLPVDPNYQYDAYGRRVRRRSSSCVIL